MSDIGNFVVSLIGVIVALFFLAVFVYSIVWAYGDAERRGKSGCLVALLVFLLTWPVGLIIWLLIRPEEKM
jgi:preprotein translocase subunit SecG